MRAVRFVLGAALGGALGLLAWGGYAGSLPDPGVDELGYAKPPPVPAWLPWLWVAAGALAGLAVAYADHRLRARALRRPARAGEKP